MKWWFYDGDTVLSVVPDVGRYYLYVQTTDGSEKYSEVFTVTEHTETTASITGFIDIGLPFFDDINKQLRYRPYFSAYLSNWLSADNRIPSFQFNVGTTIGIDTFDLVNSETGATTDYLGYATAWVDVTVLGTEYVYTHIGVTDVSVSNGRYYFHVVGTGGKEFWSEEFVMCGQIEESSDYLLLTSTDYLLIGGTDRLKIG